MCNLICNKFDKNNLYCVEFFVVSFILEVIFKIFMCKYMCLCMKNVVGNKEY